MSFLTRALPAAALLMLLVPSRAAAVDETAGKERLGVRFGYVESFDGLHASYGNGWDLTLLFTEKVYANILLDIRLGAVYLGDALNPDLDDLITFSPGIVSQMRFLYVSAGPLAGFRMGESYAGYASAGIGIYSVSMVFDSGISAFDYSDQHVGFNGGIGLSRRVSTNWSLELNGTVHYFPVDKNATDLYYVFTDGADAPLIAGVALGVMVDLR